MLLDAGALEPEDIDRHTWLRCTSQIHAYMSKRQVPIDSGSEHGKVGTILRYAAGQQGIQTVVATRERERIMLNVVLRNVVKIGSRKVQVDIKLLDKFVQDDSSLPIHHWTRRAIGRLQLR